MKKIVPYILVVLMASACAPECDYPDVPVAHIPALEVERLEDVLFQMESTGEVLAFLQANPVLKTEFLGSAQYPNDSILAEVLLSRMNNPFIDTLKRESQEVFGDLSMITTELAEAIGRLKTFYPEAKIPKVQTMITGFGTSEMYVSDSLIIIGLDYYIGDGASFRPNDYPNYILKRYQPAYIVPAIMLMLSEPYVVTDYQDQTMLADMVYYGKKYHFAKSTLPCVQDSLLIWYTGQELVDVKENQHIIWGNFLQNELLFETSHITKEKFLGERPNTYEISAVCPGRIGAWVGWEIVRKYASDNPNVSMPEVMLFADANQLFNASNYKGKSPGFF